MLDQARQAGTKIYQFPDQIWLAQWDGDANTASSYVAVDGWAPGGRVKQYAGGHNERWGGYTINIDSNYLSLGTPTAAPETHCGGVAVDFLDYPRVNERSDPSLVKAFQCLLTEQGAYDGPVNGKLGSATVAAMNGWQKSHGLRVWSMWGRTAWMTLLVGGEHRVLKIGSTGPAVRDLQRTLNAAMRDADLPVTGLFTASTGQALKDWQTVTGQYADGIANIETWATLARGLRS